MAEPATDGDGTGDGRDHTATDGKGASWQQAHAALVRLARSRAGLDLDEGQWLLAALRSRAHARLGYGSFDEYVERLFGYASCGAPCRY